MRPHTGLNASKQGGMHSARGMRRYVQSAAPNNFRSNLWCDLLTGCVPPCRWYHGVCRTEPLLTAWTEGGASQSEVTGSPASPPQRTAVAPKPAAYTCHDRQSPLKVTTECLAWRCWLRSAPRRCPRGRSWPSSRARTLSLMGGESATGTCLTTVATR